MISGVLYALLAGMLWGLIFVGPLIVPDYPAALQSTGRYLALGIIALPLARLGRQRLRQLTQKDWLTALALTMMGNLIYYVCLASAIQRTGAPVSTMIIGTLPVVIPICANLLYSQRDGKRTDQPRPGTALYCGGTGLRQYSRTARRPAGVLTVALWLRHCPCAGFRRLLGVVCAA